jgi:hypothetical protein
MRNKKDDHLTNWILVDSEREGGCKTWFKRLLNTVEN